MLKRLFTFRRFLALVLAAVMLYGAFLSDAVLLGKAYALGSNAASVGGEAEVLDLTEAQGAEIVLSAPSYANGGYTIRYDPNPEYINKTDADVFSLTGKELPMADSTHTFGEWKQLNKNDYGIVGYEFVGWNTRPDGQGTIEDLVAEVQVNFFVESSDGNVDMIFSAVYKVGEVIEVPADPIHWSVDPSTKEDSNHFTYTFEKWENITDPDGLDIDYRSGAVRASNSVNYLAKFQKDTVSWFIKGDPSTLKASTGVAANDNWVQARYDEALANSNVPTGQLVVYPTNAGLQTAKRLSLMGTLDSQSGVGSAPWYSKVSSIKSVYVRPGVRANGSAKGLFADLTLATAIDVQNLNTALVTNFNSMFLNAESAKTINVTGLNTSAGTDFANMFDDCYVVTKISGVENLDVSKATTIELMFSECKKLASLDLSKWDTSKVKNFRGTFSGMHSLKFNDSIGNLNTASATNMSIMFQYCLQFVDIAFGSRFVTNNVTNMSGMFNYCENLVELDISYFNTRKVNNFNKIASNNTTPMFDSCPKLAVIHVGANFGFKGDGSTTVSGGLNGYLPNPEDSPYSEIGSTSQGYWFADSDGDKFMYNNIPNYVAGGDTYRIYKSYAALYGTKDAGLTFVLGRTAADTAPATYNGANRYLTVWNVENTAFASADGAGWSGYRSYVKSVVVLNELKPRNMGYWFYNFNNCTSYNLAKLNTSKCVAFNHLFYANDSITKLDISKFNTSAATLFQGMFYNCGKLTELNLSSFNMTKATNVNNMFYGMKMLQAVHFGANWKWVDTGGYLPNQSGVISGADGKWHTASGSSYAPASVPAGAGSYYATSALAAATLSSFDDGAVSLESESTVHSLEANTVPDHSFGNYVVSATNLTASNLTSTNLSVMNLTASGIDGGLVDPDVILFFHDEEMVLNLTEADGGVVTLYAIWKPIEYSIHYNPNGENVTGEMPDSLHVYNQPSVLSPVGYNRIGYSFSGWATKPDGGVVYRDKAEILNLTDNAGDVIELYAVWDPISYTITYDGNGETGGETPDSTHVYDVPEDLTKNGYFKTGYEFVGWNTEPDGTGTFYPDESNIKNLSSVDGDIIVFYAQWKFRPISAGFSGYFRFISDRYFDTLEPNSKWRDGELQELLQKTLASDMTDYSVCVMVWHFTPEEYEAVREWCLERDKGTATNRSFLNQFYLDYCIEDHTD